MELFPNLRIDFAIPTFSFEQKFHTLKKMFISGIEYIYFFSIEVNKGSHKYAYS